MAVEGGGFKPQDIGRSSDRPSTDRPLARQTGLPGLVPATDAPNSVLQRLHELHETDKHAVAEDAKAKDEHIILEAIRTSYKEHILVPRQEIWKETVDTLQTAPPDIDISGAGRTFELQWKFTRDIAHPEYDAQITASLSTGRIYFRNQDRQYEELQQAMRYLHEGKAAFGRTLTLGRKVPDSLLGVESVPHPTERGRIIPTDELRMAAVDNFLDMAPVLAVDVQAERLGTGETTRIAKFLINRNERIQEDPFGHLNPEQLDTLYDDLRRGKHTDGIRIPQPALGDLQRFLDEKYIKPGIGANFEQLAEVNDILLFRARSATTEQTT